MLLMFQKDNVPKRISSCSNFATPVKLKREVGEVKC